MSDLEEKLAGQIRMVGLPEPERQYRFVPKRQFRADFAWPTIRLLCEVEGGTWLPKVGRQAAHSTGQGIERDCEKSNWAAVLGWTLIRVTTTMIKDGRALRWIETAIGACAVSEREGEA